MPGTDRQTDILVTDQRARGIDSSMNSIQRSRTQTALSRLPLFLALAIAQALAAQNSNSRATTTAGQINQMWSRGQARGDGPVKLQSFPLRIEDIGYIIPLGNMQSGHTTPSDHLYLAARNLLSQVPGRSGPGRASETGWEGV